MLSKSPIYFKKCLNNYLNTRCGLISSGDVRTLTLTLKIPSVSTDVLMNNSNVFLLRQWIEMELYRLQSFIKRDNGMLPIGNHGRKLSVTDFDVQELAHLCRDFLSNKMLLRLQHQQS